MDFITLSVRYVKAIRCILCYRQGRYHSPYKRAESI